ncbi:sensor histidine kinase [Thermodesulfobacteriota bacterium]
MNQRAIILYWLLLLVPTLVVGTVAFYLLAHERDRINRLELESIRDRAQVLAESLQITMEAVQEDLTEALYTIPEDRMAQTLSQWEKTNPLVRNVFVWSDKTGLRFPDVESATQEEQRFMARYEALFSGRIPWRPGRGPNVEAETSTTVTMLRSRQQVQTRSIGQRQTLVRDIRQLRIGRRKLEDLAREPGQDVRRHKNDRRVHLRKEGGWIPWFTDNRLHIMGWVRKAPDGPVYGVELELMAVLSRLITDFPSATPDGVVYTLNDGEGRILHQSGDRPLEKDAAPVTEVGLSPQLPHWRIAAYSTDRSLLGRSGRGFFLVSCLLLGIFLSAIILGGSLLTWQAHRNMRESQQKTSFVSNVSHELKTPLTSIRMYAELLSEERVEDPRRRSHYLKVIVDETRRLTRLVNNVLDFSRLEMGRMKYHVEEAQLGGILQELLDSHRLRIQEAGMTLEERLPDQRIVLSTDRQALQQALLNLLDNGVKYASEGGELVVSASIADGSCRISVLDRGPGVPSNHRAAIFKKFHRVDDSLTTRRQGSGLGLTIARKILRDLGGDLTYEPRNDGGSCFTASIPV